MMLAVLLYTGCDCYGDLRAADRVGDYDKWKTFAKALCSALEALSSAHQAKFGPPSDYSEAVVYSGLANVRLNSSPGRYINMATFTSTSTELSVAEGVRARVKALRTNLTSLLFQFRSSWAMKVS